MTDDVFEKLIDALDRLPNGFPRTRSRIELRLLRKIFTEEQARVACVMSRIKESAEDIAERAGMSNEQAISLLDVMAKAGLVWRDKKDEVKVYRLAPFVVGIYEWQLSNMDHELAHLVEEYMLSGGAAGIMKPQPALHRTVPANLALKREMILPYDDVKAMLMGSRSFRLQDCICRKQQELLGKRDCEFPMRSCLAFSTREWPEHPDTISRQKALEFLEEVERIGLVHSVSNVSEGMSYVCNCCGCCCAILRGITEWGIEKSMAAANYYAVIDAEKCTDCGTCRDRCQVDAISEQDDVSVVDLSKCIGCGLCVTGCQNEAARLERKSKEEMVTPPETFEAWELERLCDRGLST